MVAAITNLIDPPPRLTGDSAHDTVAVIQWLNAFYVKGVLSGALLQPQNLPPVLSDLGTGDVLGPAAAVDGNVVLFDTATGKLIKDGGTLGSAAFTESGAYDVAGAAAAAQAASQPADADLTTWAGITPGANVGTALAVAVGTDGAVVVKGGALGTPSSGVGANITGVNAATLGGATFAAPGAIGGTTPAAISVTTVAGTGKISTTQGGVAIDGFAIVPATNTDRGLYRITNLSSDTIFGAQGSSATGIIISGASAYDAAIRSTSGISLSADGGSNTHLRISSSGGVFTVALSATTTIRPGGYTVGTLPAGTVGMKAYVTDALAPAYLVLLAAGGAAYSGAQYNGTQWVGD